VTEVLLGVDIGGTTIAAGLVTPAGAVLAEAATPTHRHGPGTAVPAVESLIQDLLAQAVRQGATVVGIGVGAPGIVDAASGCVGRHTPHVPELAGFALAPVLAARFGLPVFLDNDVNALALGEWMFGEGRGAESLVVLAPGTGFGAAVVLDGRLVRGVSGYGGEFGHAPVKFDGPACWCGGRGCLALYASGRGIAERAREAAASGRAPALAGLAGGEAARITAAHVFGAALEGEPAAAAIVDEACRALGAAIATIVNGLNPAVLVITGGVAASYARLEKRVLAAAAEYCFRDALAATRLRIVPGDKRITMRGAAALVVYEMRGPARPRAGRP
jgi:glucokinase